MSPVPDSHSGTGAAEAGGVSHTGDHHQEPQEASRDNRHRNGDGCHRPFIRRAGSDPP